MVHFISFGIIKPCWLIGRWPAVGVAHLDHVVDPAEELGDFGVDAGMVGLGAARPPADHAHQPPHAVILAHQRPAAVSLGGERDGAVSRHGGERDVAVQRKAQHSRSGGADPRA